MGLISGKLTASDNHSGTLEALNAASTGGKILTLTVRAQ